MRSKTLLALAALGLATGASPAGAQVTQAGRLTCEVAAGVGLLVGSSKPVTCTFQNAAGRLETYDGSLTRLGFDVGFTTSGVLVWDVLAPSGNLVAGALAGDYAGAGAQVTVVAGLGANVLVGGSGRSVALQPLSVTGQTGLDVAGGVTGLSLRLRPEAPARRRGRG